MFGCIVSSWSGMPGVQAELRKRGVVAERRLEWGAEGPDDYHGELRVDELTVGRSRITVSLHSVREAESSELQDGLEQTVAALIQAAAADDQSHLHGGPPR